jgi:hypothetical protein
LSNPADQIQLPMRRSARSVEPVFLVYLVVRSDWLIPMTYTKVMAARSKSATATWWSMFGNKTHRGE